MELDSYRRSKSCHQSFFRRHRWWPEVAKSSHQCATAGGHQPASLFCPTSSHLPLQFLIGSQADGAVVAVLWSQFETKVTTCINVSLPSAQFPVEEQSEEKKSRSLEHEVCGVDHLVLANGQLGFPH